MIDNLDHS